MTEMPLEARRMLAIQAALTLAVATGFALTLGEAHGRSALFGGAMALVNGCLMALIVARATRAALRQPGAETLVLYGGAGVRFVLVAALFALGLGGLALAPVPLLIGFAVVHGAFFLSRLVVVTQTSAASRDNDGE